MERVLLIYILVIFKVLNQSDLRLLAIYGKGSFFSSPQIFQQGTSVYRASFSGGSSEVLGIVLFSFSGKLFGELGADKTG